jgi:flavodoxin
MRALVIYESMYGNTHRIAEAVTEGLIEEGIDAVTIPIDEATGERVTSTDLVVVGGPTHAHGMSRSNTRRAAAEDAAEPGSDLHLEPHAEEAGLREWFDALPPSSGPAAAFDTRFSMPAVLTGRASKGISKHLRRLGRTEVTEPTSFLVRKGNTLVDGEEHRAREWGRALARSLNADQPATAEPERTAPSRLSSR